MIKTKSILRGFTLSETLTNIIIVTSLSFAMMFVFLQLKKNFDTEENRTNIVSYANRVLDELATELSNAEQATFSNNRGILNLSYPESNRQTTYRISKKLGILKIIDGNDVTIDESYIPRDKHDRLKYEISTLSISDSVGIDAELIGMNLTSPALTDVLDSSYKIYLEIQLFDIDNHLIEVLQFNRRVFSPSKLLHDPGINS